MKAFFFGSMFGMCLTVGLINFIESRKGDAPPDGYIRKEYVCSIATASAWAGYREATNGLPWFYVSNNVYQIMSLSNNK